MNITDSYSLARMDNYFDSLGNAVVLGILDCKSGYWQVQAAEKDKDKRSSHLTWINSLQSNAIRIEECVYHLRENPGYFLAWDTLPDLSSLFR